VTEGQRDPYAILRVHRDATRGEVGRAYRDLAKRTHPDVGGVAPAAMQELNWAWHLLSDPRRRLEWDRTHPSGSSAGHWAREGPPEPPAVAQPEADARYEGWSGQAAWTASGEPWAGAGAPTVESRTSFGCIGLALIVILICGFVLVASLYPDIRFGIHQESAAPQSSIAPVP
jgi:curved DNA-binding protein CbpA